jgi:uncharacterized membrane protein
MEAARTEGGGVAVIARPLAMLVLGGLAAAAAWHVLMREPARPGVLEAARREQVSPDDRAALDAMLRATRPGTHAR